MHDERNPDGARSGLTLSAPGVGSSASNWYDLLHHAPETNGPDQASHGFHQMQPAYTLAPYTPPLPASGFHFKFNLESSVKFNPVVSVTGTAGT